MDEVALSVGLDELVDVVTLNDVDQLAVSGQHGELHLRRLRAELQLRP